MSGGCCVGVCVQTSGVLVVAKDREHAAECVKLFASRRVRKVSLAGRLARVTAVV